MSGLNLHRELEATFVCAKCGGKPYRLWRVQKEPGSSVYLHEIEALNGAPEVEKIMGCPDKDCGGELKRG